MSGMELADFLLARIAEDEKTALAVERVDWHLNEWTSGECAEHGDRWSPAHVLTECETKRQIVELHAATKPEADRDPDLRVKLSRCTADWELFPCPTLQLLALPYADHPDYREEWKP